MAIQVWTPETGFTRKTKPVIVKPTVVEKPTPAQPSKAKRRKPSERQRAYWLKQNQITARTIADQYLVKQAKTKTPMMFVSYGRVFPCTITKLRSYDIDLMVDGRKKRIHKLDMALYYKASDAPAVEKLLTFDSDSVTGRPPQKLSELDVVDLSVLERGRAVTLTLRTGHRLTGVVRWFCVDDIGLTCGEGVKVHLFRHAISTVSLNANEKPRP